MRLAPAQLCSLVLGCCLCITTLSTSADETAAPLLRCGDEEREDAGSACQQESAFLAGNNSPALHLRIGGEAWGCDSEWATSLEFDLSPIPVGLQVYAATLVVRKTGYSDDAQGFFYVGVFPYAATGAIVSIPRATLTPDTALDIVYPPAANVDLAFDVTPAVREWVATGVARAGLLLAGVYSEVGYDDWISVGGAGSTFPPRLHVVHEGTVGAPATSWAGVKSLYR